MNVAVKNILPPTVIGELLPTVTVGGVQGAVTTTLVVAVALQVPLLTFTV